MAERIPTSRESDTIRREADDFVDVGQDLRNVQKRSKEMRKGITEMGDTSKIEKALAELGADRETEPKESKDGQQPPPPDKPKNHKDNEKNKGTVFKHTLADHMGEPWEWREWTDKKLKGIDNPAVRWIRRAIWIVPTWTQILQIILFKEAREAFWEQCRESYDMKKKKAAGMARELAAKMHSFGRVLIPYEYAAIRGIVLEFIKEYNYASKEKVMHTAELIADWGNEEGGDRRKALLIYAASEGYIDDIMGQEVFKKRLQKLGAEKYGYKHGEWYNEILIREFLADFLTGVSLSDSKIGTGVDLLDPVELQLIEDLETQGKAVNHWEYLGHTHVDSITGKHFVSRVGLRYKLEEQRTGSKLQVGYAVDEDDQRVKIDGKEVISWFLKEKGEPDGVKPAIVYDRGEAKWLVTLANNDGTYEKVYKTGAEILASGAMWLSKEQTEHAVGEFAKGGSRVRGPSAPHNNNTLAEDGAATLLSALNIEMIKKNPAMATDSSFAQERTVWWTFGDQEKKNIHVLGLRGEVVIDKPVLYKKLVSIAKANPMFLKGVYAKAAQMNNATYVSGLQIKYVGNEAQLLREYPEFEGRESFSIGAGIVGHGSARFKDGTRIGVPGDKPVSEEERTSDAAAAAQELIDRMGIDMSDKGNTKVWVNAYDELRNIKNGGLIEEAVSPEVELAIEEAQDILGEDLNQEEKDKVTARAMRKWCKYYLQKAA